MSTDAKSYVIPQPPQPAIPVAGANQFFPVRRLWCVGRNYVEHIKEMGQDAVSYTHLDVYKRQHLIVLRWREA